MTNVAVVTPWTALLNVAVMLLPTATAVAFTAGARAVTVGAMAGATGVTGAEAADSGPVPIVFTPATVKVYVVPLVRPVTVVLAAVPVAGTGMPVTARCVTPLTFTRMVKLVSPTLDGKVKFTVAWALPAVTEVIVGWAGSETASVWSLNFSCSTLNSVSVPSPVAGTATVGGTDVLSATVMEPFGFAVIEYWARGPAKVAVSQFFAAVPAAQSAGVVAVFTLFTISRTPTRLPGSTSPAKTACWRVMPAVPVPKLPDVALFSIRSVRPISVAGLAGSVRRLIAVRSSLSPSMT